MLLRISKHWRRDESNVSQIWLSSATYATGGSLTTETNALNGVTFYASGTNASGQTVLTNAYPDGGVRLETYYGPVRERWVNKHQISPQCFNSSDPLGVLTRLSSGVG